MTFLSIEKRDGTPKKPHYIPSARPFQVELPGQPFARRSNVKQPSIRPASMTGKPAFDLNLAIQPCLETDLELPTYVLEPFEFIHAAPVRNDLYLTLGTSVVDPEKEPSWTNAAVYPQVPTTQDLPIMRVIGQSAPSVDHIQVAPGMFWWASSSLCISLSVPVRLMGTASDWGVLLALNY